MIDEKSRKTFNYFIARFPCAWHGVEVFYFSACEECSWAL